MNIEKWQFDVAWVLKRGIEEATGHDALAWVQPHEGGYIIVGSAKTPLGELVSYEKFAVPEHATGAAKGALESMRACWEVKSGTYVSPQERAARKLAGLL